MTRTQTSRRRAGGFAVAFLLATIAASPGTASALRLVPQTSPLSPRLSALAKPAVHSSSYRLQAKDLGIPAHGPGSLLREGNRVLVELKYNGGAAAAAAAARGAGAEVIDVNARYGVIAAAVRPDELSTLGHLPQVSAATEVVTPIVAGLAQASVPPCFGADTSEGDDQLHAAQARAEFGLDGSDVKVGILSDSFDLDALTPTGAREDVLSGDLPGAGNPCGYSTPVEVLDDSEAEGEDEGRAMAQIVHDLAPGAAISFATAFKGLTPFADNIKALAANGASVIADDISYFEEPFFQEGPVGNAITEVTEDGVSYFSAAGNNNLRRAGRNIASWEAPEYRDAHSCPAAVQALSAELEGEGRSGLNPFHCMNFNPGGPADTTFGITVAAGASLVADLQWAEPWEGVKTDLDAFLLNPGGEVISDSVDRNVSRTHRPYELVGWENETGGPVTVRLAINRWAGGADPRLKFALLENGSGVTATEYESPSGEDKVGPTIFGHNGAEDATSVGAISFGASEAPEAFSSRGPVTYYFGPVAGETPATALGSPQVLVKPDVVATDGGANTFFGECLGSVWRFYGTSAAAPHAAAVAALMREGDPTATPADISQAMRESAVPVGGFPATAVGSGLLDAVTALEDLGLTAGEPGAEVVEPPPPGPCLPPRERTKPVPSSTEVLPVTPPPVEGSHETAKRPRTFFLQRPSRVIRTHHQQAKAVFRFGSNESDTSFVCRVDGSFFRPCPARLARRFALGWHVVKVAARDAAGNGDKTPASYTFKVKRVR
ncbi:MAG TPA: S8 family serine peptidase [Solirubrobacterales bacterium]|nr:S8 family serine peptidase [Solirubrobacterales bacterium]